MDKKNLLNVFYVVLQIRTLKLRIHLRSVRGKNRTRINSNNEETFERREVFSNNGYPILNLINPKTILPFLFFFFLFIPRLSLKVSK